MAERHNSFMNCVEARHVRPGWLLGSVADLFKSEWLVESTASVVATREIQLTMRCGNRVVTKATAAEDTVLRKMYLDGN